MSKILKNARKMRVNVNRMFSEHLHWTEVKEMFQIQNVSISTSTITRTVLLTGSVPYSGSLEQGPVSPFLPQEVYFNNFGCSSCSS